MYRRRPHRKSRTGCLNCKRRKTKCDEVHPACTNCTKYDLECEYQPPKPTIRSQTAPSAKNFPLKKLASSDSSSNYQSPYSLSLHPPCRCQALQDGSSSVGSEDLANLTFTEYDSDNSTIDPRLREGGFLQSMTVYTSSDRLLELRLLHHFTQIGSKSLFKLLSLSIPPGEPLEDCSSWVLEGAMRSTCLMDAVLGFAAFDLREQEPDNTELSQASHRYMTKAIEAHNQQLREGISTENADIVLATSITIAFVTVGHHRYLSHGEENVLPLHWFQPWHGICTVADAAWNLVQSQNMKHILEVECSTSTIRDAHLQHLYTQFDFLLEDLEPDDGSDETVEAYVNSVKWLAVIYSDPEIDYAFKFTGKVGPRFVQLLAQNDPRTLTILGYFFMLLYTRKQVSWTPGIGRKDFCALMKLLPEEWKPRMHWAVQEFEAREH